MFTLHEAWEAARPVDRLNRLPDAVTDSDGKRRRLAGEKMRTVVAGVIEQAKALGLSGELVMLTLPLSGELYDTASHKAARVTLRGLSSGLPAWCVLASGRRGGKLHAHILTPIERLQDLDMNTVPGLHVRELWWLRGMVEYLCKPAEEKAAKSNYERSVPLIHRLSASNSYLKARSRRWTEEGKRRLYPRSFVVNVPKKRRAAPAPGLLLACLLTVLRLDAERAARLRERRGLFLALRKVQARRQPFPAPRVQTVCRWPAAGLPVRHAVPLLIGHARPPPMA